MLSKTRGVVLHHFKYTDNSVIACIYTENHGRQSFIIKGVRSRKSGIRISYLQPLSLLEMEVYYEPKRELQRIKEARINPSHHGISSHIIKSTLALFLADVLYKTLHEEEPNHPLFSFIWHSVELLDVETKGLANFHLAFLMQYSRYLGFFPRNNYSESTPYFDLKNGLFTSSIPHHTYFTNLHESRLFNKIISLQYERLEDLSTDHETRYFLLLKIIEYFKLHTGKATNIKSLDVLKGIFET